jgi:intron-binding protein aquarius
LLQVERLAKLLKVNESVAYTCETAGHFWLLHVLARWEKFTSQCAATKTAECVKGAPGSQLIAACWFSLGGCVLYCCQQAASSTVFPPMAPSVSAAELFPFAEYFSDAAQPLFKGELYEEDLEKAQVRLAAGCGGLLYVWD